MEMHSQVCPGSDGTGTLCDCPFNGNYAWTLPWRYPSRLQFGRVPDFQFELFPVHSQLLGESLLVSFPPLNNMLKFSGFPCLISGRKLRSVELLFGSFTKKNILDNPSSKTSYKRLINLNAWGHRSRGSYRTMLLKKRPSF